MNFHDPVNLMDKAPVVKLGALVAWGFESLRGHQI